MGSLLEDGLQHKTLEQLAEEMSLCQPGAVSRGKYEAEITRRVTQAQIEAAEATKAAAFYSQRNAKYMKWSVIVLAVSSALSLLVQVGTLISSSSHPAGAAQPLTAATAQVATSK